MSISSIGLIFQVTAAILSIFFYKKHKSSFYKILCSFLIVVAVTEVAGFYQLIYNYFKNNEIHYLGAFFQFGLIALMYYQILKDKKWKKLILVLSVLFFTYWVWGLSNYITYFSQIVTFGCFNTSIVAFLYLRELLMSNKILNYKKHLPFWVSVGFLIFYLPAIPFFSIMPFMKSRDLFFILFVLIILMNLLIITGLIWSKKEVKY